MERGPFQRVPQAVLNILPVEWVDTRGRFKIDFFKGLLAIFEWCGDAWCESSVGIGMSQKAIVHNLSGLLLHQLAQLYPKERYWRLLEAGKNGHGLIIMAHDAKTAIIRASGATTLETLASAVHTAKILSTSSNGSA